MDRYHRHIIVFPRYIIPAGAATALLCLQRSERFEGKILHTTQISNTLFDSLIGHLSNHNPMQIFTLMTDRLWLICVMLQKASSSPCFIVPLMFLVASGGSYNTFWEHAQAWVKLKSEIALVSKSFITRMTQFNSSSFSFSSLIWPRGAQSAPLCGLTAPWR